MTTMPRRMSDEEKIEFRARVAALYGEGKSIREIAVLTNRTLATIRRNLTDAGVPRRQRGSTKRQADQGDQ